MHIQEAEVDIVHYFTEMLQMYNNSYFKTRILDTIFSFPLFELKYWLTFLYINLVVRYFSECN